MNTKNILDHMAELISEKHRLDHRLDQIRGELNSATVERNIVLRHLVLSHTALEAELSPFTYDSKNDVYTDKKTGETYMLRNV